MIEASHCFFLDQPPRVVFDYLAHPENDAHWQSSCQSVRLISVPNADVGMSAGQSGSSCSVGSKYRIAFSFLGREMNFLCEVTDRDPGRLHAFKVIEGSFPYQGRYHFAPRGQGTEVRWFFSAEPAGFFGILPATLLSKVLLSQFERDIERLRDCLLSHHQP